ncbi:MAG TPA: hypothetical protein PLD20_07030 [Blastocatellia bacterium]|nr:hypothetical protein [Blastocatellia bacterium]HMV81544.1 hypothetical protein [Blastocatellia bacterium]HMX25762.1 hypothetical protein [Blastocatellia bacterium]HMY70789.1 hypothetical protein [Blastocatellia bacterium]HMZ17663.1 hypothetical protein [Blastocatellia bacterium]
MRILTLESIDVGRRAVFCRFGLGDLRFSTSLWYEDIDLEALGRHSPEGLRRLIFHIGLFELNRFCSLRPDGVRLGRWAGYLTPALENLWREIFRKVWAQWRYENDDPTYDGPVFLDAERAAQSDSGKVAALVAAPARSGPEVALLCGGGKDSLISMRLFSEAGVPFDTCAYSSSVYGLAAPQHELIDRLIDRVGADSSTVPRRLRQYHYDDLMDSPVLRAHPELGVRTLTEAETPFSVFAALPMMLANGHRALSIGHERSADRGQVCWARTGEDVNHQWGKSAAAERLLNRYLAEELRLPLHCFSPLKPIYDVVIFALMRRYESDVPFIHSCNLRKPWCLRCPKCLYVWLGCAAMLPRRTLVATFGNDGLLEDHGRADDFAALMGAGRNDGRTPFECIGHAEETRLYLSVCAARGYCGPAIDLLRERYGPPATALPLLERYLNVDEDPGCTAMPVGMRQTFIPLLKRAAAEAETYLRGHLTPETNS